MVSIPVRRESPLSQLSSTKAGTTTTLNSLELHHRTWCSDIWQERVLQECCSPFSTPMPKCIRSSKTMSHLCTLTGTIVSCHGLSQQEHTVENSDSKESSIDLSSGSTQAVCSMSDLGTKLTWPLD
jgi:hypothetical protein